LLEEVRFRLSTDRGGRIVESSDVASIVEALDVLVGDPSVVNLLQRARFVYGRIWTGLSFRGPVATRVEVEENCQKDSIGSTCTV
jgi:hypothetical protein